MKPNYVQPVTNWGNFPVVEKEMRSDDALSGIKKFVKKNSEVIARGNGRCYGDASLGEHIFSTKRLNKFIHFDRLNGIIECESGVLLSDVLEVVVPQGYFLYVTPGTKFISVGGAIASDVHGKNHHAEGCFSEWVISFQLLNEIGEVITCSREESIKAENLDEIFRLFDESEDWTYNVAWIDCLQKGKNIGRSILMRGEHALKAELPSNKAEKPLRLKGKLEPNVPFYFPGFVLNALTVKIFNWLYFGKQRKKEVKNFVDYETFFYPLDAIHNWNRIYGKSGFIQYQMVIPKEQGKEGMKKILETIAHSGNGSFLAVLKLFGKNNPQAYNSFPMEGYTLALDFKVNSKLKKLVHQLDEIVEQYGGRIYLTKDSMSKSSLTNYLKNVDSSKFVSLQHKRILKHANL